MEKHSVARLIRASPGYVGYDEGGQLTEAVRRKPYAVILFSEIEQAHPDVFDVLLQVLDDGGLTGAQGRTADFKNTVIFMSSNIGSPHLLESITGDSIPEAVRETVMADLRKAFRPESLNWIDETLLFKPLTIEEITSIVNLLLADLNKRLADRRVREKLDRRAKDWVAEKGYDPVFGARPLKRFLAAQHRDQAGACPSRGQKPRVVDQPLEYIFLCGCNHLLKLWQLRCMSSAARTVAVSAAGWFTLAGSHSKLPALALK